MSLNQAIVSLYLLRPFGWYTIKSNASVLSFLGSFFKFLSNSVRLVSYLSWLASNVSPVRFTFWVSALCLYCCCCGYLVFCCPCHCAVIHALVICRRCYLLLVCRDSRCLPYLASSGFRPVLFYLLLCSLFQVCPPLCLLIICHKLG